MPEMLSFNKHEVPIEIAAQIRSYTRVQWPRALPPLPQLWDREPRAHKPVNHVLMEGELLVSHVEVNQRDLMHAGQTLRVYGLSAVFTYPDFRGQGHGGRLVQAATQHIRGGDADVAMLFCGERVSSLYQRCGWERTAPPRITYGTSDAPQEYRDVLMMLFVSPLGQSMRDAFASQPLHVGERTW